MTRTCSIEGCKDKHLAKGYCRKHYMKYWRKSDNKSDIITEHVEQSINPIEKEETTDDKKPGGYKYDLEDDIKIGQEPISSSITSNPLPLSDKQFYVSIGVEYVEMAYEFMNDLAPSAKTKLILREVQKQNLQKAFDALGFGTNNPWVVIFFTIVPPVILFIIMNYKEIKKNMKEMFGDLKGLLPSLMPRTFKTIDQISTERKEHEAVTATQ